MLGFKTIKKLIRTTQYFIDINKLTDIRNAILTRAGVKDGKKNTRTDSDNHESKRVVSATIINLERCRQNYKWRRLQRTSRNTSTTRYAANIEK